MHEHVTYHFLKVFMIDLDEYFGKRLEVYGGGYSIVSDKFLEATCKQLEANWRAGWCRKGLQVAASVNKVPDVAIGYFCSNEFMDWWLEIDS